MIETTPTVHQVQAPRPSDTAPPPRGNFGISAPVPVFAITSGKGGVGKTNVTANLAAALALNKRRVLVIDADLGLPNLDILLGVNPLYTLADFFNGAASLDEIITPSRSGIWFLPGAGGAQELTALSRDQKLALLTELDELTCDLEIALVDTGSGISDSVTYFAASAQEIIVVVTPEPASMTDAYALVKVLALRHRQNRFWILANAVAGEEQALRLFEALSRTALYFLNVSLDYLGWIPTDSHLARAVARSRVVVEDAADAPSSRAFGTVAQRVMRAAVAGAGMKGNLQFFLRRMLARRRGEP